VRLVDAVVDDPDLDPVARGGEGRRTPHLVGADQLRAAVEQRPVRDARPDLFHAGRGGQPAELGAREQDGHPVQHDLVAPGDPSSRDRPDDSVRERPLSSRERAHVVDACRRAEVEPLRPGARGQHAALLDGPRERRRVERDDHLDGLGRRGGLSDPSEENGGYRRRQQENESSQDGKASPS